MDRLAIGTLYTDIVTSTGYMDTNYDTGIGRLESTSARGGPYGYEEAVTFNKTGSEANNATSDPISPSSIGAVTGVSLLFCTVG